MGVLIVNYHNGYKVNASEEKGFTLIELSIVIIISSLLFLPLIKLYEIDQKKKKIALTKERLLAVNTLITAYGDVVASEVFPCPADPSLPETDPNYGDPFIDCLGFADEAAFLAGVAAEGLNAPGQCTNGDGTGVCLADGFTDADDDGNMDPVLIGMVPINDVASSGELSGSISYSVLSDAWGGRFTYAVSGFLTNANTYNFYGGAIRAEDEFGNRAASTDDVLGIIRGIRHRIMMTSHIFLRQTIPLFGMMYFPRLIICGI